MGSEIEAHRFRDILSANPDVMSGRTVFRGTRVSLETVVDNLLSGSSLDEILDDFPTLDQRDVTALIDLMAKAVTAARSA